MLFCLSTEAVGRLLSSPFSAAGAPQGGYYMTPTQTSCTFIEEFPQNCHIVASTLIPPKKKRVPFYDPCILTTTERTYIIQVDFFKVDIFNHAS